MSFIIVLIFFLIIGFLAYREHGYDAIRDLFEIKGVIFLITSYIIISVFTGTYVSAIVEC